MFLGIEKLLSNQFQYLLIIYTIILLLLSCFVYRIIRIYLSV